MSEAILDGIKVVELATYIAGPASGVVLADFGADVVKIEAPNRPDPFRGGISVAAMHLVPSTHMVILLIIGIREALRSISKLKQAGRPSKGLSKGLMFSLLICRYQPGNG